MQKKIIALVLALLLFVPAGALAQVEKHVILDEALALLEEGNIFLRRYNEITGSEIEAAFPLGVPYHFGGKTKEHLFGSYPEYRQMYPWNGNNGQDKSRLHIMGLDCSGYMNYVFEEAGYGEIGKLSEIMLEEEHKKKYLYSFKEGMNAPSDWEELARSLQVGDLLIASHPSRHVMIYIGTLADFGFVPGEYPELDAYLHYPLMIHSGDNPQVRDRFDELIRTNPRYEQAASTCGGVAVSILGIPVENAPKLGNVGKVHFHGYVIDEGKTHLYIWDFATVTTYAWYRPTAPAAN